MKHTKNLALLFFVATFCTGTCPLPEMVFAQTGSNGICTSTTGCTVGPSGAFIDATPYASTSSSICATIFRILTGASPAFIPGSTIDARGLNSTNTKATGSVLTCTASTSACSAWLIPAGLREAVSVARADDNRRQRRTAR